MMYLLQSLIIFTVMVSNIRLQWTPNGYLAGLIGVGLAYGLSVGLNEIWRVAESRLRRGWVYSSQPSKRMDGRR